MLRFKQRSAAQRDDVIKTSRTNNGAGATQKRVMVELFHFDEEECLKERWRGRRNLSLLRMLETFEPPWLAVARPVEQASDPFGLSAPAKNNLPNSSRQRLGVEASVWLPLKLHLRDGPLEHQIHQMFCIFKPASLQQPTNGAASCMKHAATLCNEYHAFHHIIPGIAG